ncbi:hypothetical protein M5D96_012625 [Drosophila gunungcola]|uniref:Uncharacterized protein n=1 Tax=Drosophila gunungcola TaxID=103775 RepID=A0A9P9YCP5_9MUSC|nr:hypothetical protein M5D96_012625 [Drosophila gunungcola]
MGAMNLAGTLAEAVQGGGALTRDLDFDNPLMSVHSKTALGYGDAMRPHAAGDSSEEEDRRRRKRTNPDDGEVEARRRRAQRRAANNASRSRVTPGNKKLQRRRRQTPMGTIPPGTGSGDASALGDRMRTMWLAFVDNVTEVVQQILSWADSEFDVDYSNEYDDVRPHLVYPDEPRLDKRIGDAAREFSQNITQAWHSMVDSFKNYFEELKNLFAVPTDPNAANEDLGTGVMLVVGQMQQLMENGGGLKNEQSIELLGEKVSGGLKLGFGEVMEMPLGRRRRSNAARN